MDNFEQHQMADETLDRVGKDVKLLGALEPTNKPEQKEAFMQARAAGQRYEPTLQYKDVAYDPAVKLHELSNVEVEGDDEIAQVLNQVRTNVELQLRMVQNRGDAQAMRVLNEQLYGAPTEEMVQYADRILTGEDELAKELAQKPSEKSDQDFKVESEAAVRAKLDQYGLENWKVVWQKVTSSQTNVLDRKVVLNSAGKFGPNSPAKLAAHEVEVHVLRGENGYKQPLSLFRRGFPNNVTTEEGLAVYMEKLNGVLSAASLKNYAARVIAVDAMMKGETFNASVDRLMAYGFNLEGSYDLTMRAYRGGGFAKDKEYLEGYRMIEEFVANGGDLTDLYYGKFALEHLPLVKEMAAKGLLTPKEELLIPDILRTTDITRSTALVNKEPVLTS